MAHISAISLGTFAVIAGTTKQGKDGIEKATYNGTIGGGNILLLLNNYQELSSSVI